MSWFKNMFSDKEEVGKLVNSVVEVSTKATKASSKYYDGYSEGNGQLAKKSEENYLHTSELVFSCVDYVAKTASQAVPKVFEVNPLTGDKEAITDTKLQAWASSPNAFQTWGEIIEVIVQGLFLGGNSFMSHELVAGRFESWHLGPPSQVKVVPDKRQFVKGYTYLDKVAYRKDEVIHFKNPTLNNIYYGVPSVRPLLDTLLLESSSMKELTQFYEGSTILGGVLQSEFNLSPEQIVELREQFNTLYGSRGTQRRGTAVLPAGLKYTTTQSSPKDSMLLETIDTTEQRVLRVFKINSLVLGGESTSTTNIRELLAATFSVAVRPYLYRIQDQVTLFLREKFKNPNLVFEFDLDKISELETPLDVKMTASKTGYSTGLMSLNEARSLLNLVKLDTKEADYHIVPSFLVGNDFSYLEEERVKPTDATGTSGQPAGSTSPEGGGADGIGGEQESTSNNS